MGASGAGLPVEVAAREVHIVRGGVDSGKTRALVERAAELVREGVDPGVILVLGATPDATADLARRLADADCAGVRVRCARSACLEVLDDPAARALTLRSGRLLAPFEETIVLEDLKTCGMKPRRLRGMVDFLHRGWTELADDDPDWLRGDEVAVEALLREILSSGGGISEAEVARLAVHALRGDANLQERVSADHVLVDDYPSLQRATQACAAMRARVSLFVTGDVALHTPAFETFPYAAGLNELAVARPDAAVDVLKDSGASAGIVALAGALCRAADDEAGAEQAAAALVGAGDFPRIADAAGRGVCVRGFDDPGAEAAGVAEIVREALARGMAPRDVRVVAPSRARSLEVARELRASGVPVAARPPVGALAGDVRDGQRCGAQRMFALLALAADPNDAAAWRGWCACGDELAGSLAFAALRERWGADLRGGGLLDALRAEAADPHDPVRTASATAAYLRGLELLKGLQGLRGGELLDALARAAGEPVDGGARCQFGALCGPVDPQEGAVELFARVRANLAEPTCGEGVRVGELGEWSCAPGRLVVACSLVNGLLPEHRAFDRAQMDAARQARLWRRGLERLYAVTASARDELVFTYFRSAGIERAARQGLKVERIGVRDGRRVCAVAPSAYLGALGLLDG